MSGRIPVEGIRHGDKVRLTGYSWAQGGFSQSEVFEVDDESFHRPVIYTHEANWYIMPKTDTHDYSVTKVQD